MKKLCIVFTLLCLAVLIMSCSGNFGSIQKGSISIDSTELMEVVYSAGARVLSDSIYEDITIGQNGGRSYGENNQNNYQELISCNADIEISAEGGLTLHRKETVPLSYSGLLFEYLIFGVDSTYFPVIREFEKLDNERIKEILTIKDVPVGTTLNLKVVVKLYVKINAVGEQSNNMIPSVTFECESDTITVASGDNEIILYAKRIPIV